MFPNVTLRSLGVSILAIFVFGMSAAVGATPRPLLYDGALLSPSGTKLTGTWDVSVSLFDEMEGGNELYSEAFESFSVVGGTVSFVLGSNDPASLAAAFAQNNVWLEFHINGETLLPRQRVVSVPYTNIAGNSERLGGVDASEYLEPPDVGLMAYSNEYGDLDGTPTLADLILDTDADATFLNTSGDIVVGDLELQGGVVSATNTSEGNAGEDVLVVAAQTTGTAQLPVPGFTVDPTGTLASGLVNYWPMDTPGGTVVPSVGTGTFTSFSTTSVAGILGNGRNFTGGVGSYLIVNPWNSAPSTAVTISLWMKSSDTVNAGSLFSYAKQVDNDLLLYNTQDLALYVTGQAAASAITLSDGLWHHVVATWRSSDGAGRFYVDGQLIWTTTLAVGASLGNGGSLVLGQDQDSIGGGFSGPQSYIGVLDELAIWSRVLSDQEIAALWDNGQGSFYRTTGSFGAAISLKLTDPSGTTVDGARLLAQLGENAGETFVGMETRTAGAALKRTLRFSADGGLTLKGNLTVSGAPDFAENVFVSDADIRPGHVVALAPVANSVSAAKINGPYDGFVVQKASLMTGDKQTSWVGVVGMNSGAVLYAPTTAVTDGERTASDQRSVVLVGRVLVQLDPEGPPIHAGDPVGLSTTSGLAKRYGGTGPVFAQALESWECIGRTGNCPRTILVMVYPGFGQPNCAADNKKAELNDRLHRVAANLSRLEETLKRFNDIDSFD